MDRFGGKALLYVEPGLSVRWPEVQVVGVIQLEAATKKREKTPSVWCQGPCMATRGIQALRDRGQSHLTLTM